MANRKRDSKVLRASKVRIAGMKSIDEKLELAPGVSVKSYEAASDELDEKVSAYNQLIADTAAARAEVEAQEAVVADLTKRVLTGVATRFGEDSAEYTQVGGTRTSDRKHYGQRKKQQAARKLPHKRGEVVVMPSQLATAVNGTSTTNGVAKAPVTPVVTQ